MAAIDTIRTHSVTGPVGRNLTKFVAAISAWFDARATRKALSQLSDHELDDIGLSRSQIDQIGIYH